MLSKFYARPQLSNISNSTFNCLVSESVQSDDSKQQSKDSQAIQEDQVDQSDQKHHWYPTVQRAEG